MDFLKYLLQWAFLRTKIWFNDFVGIFPSPRHAYVFLSVMGALFVFALGFLTIMPKWEIFLSDEAPKWTITVNEPTVKIKGIIPERQEPSVRGTGVTTKSSEYENLKDKLIEERRILAVKAVLTNSGISIETTENIVTATMVQLEIEVLPGVLPSGTRADLSVSGTDLRSQLITPGRYRYLISFKSSGENELIIASKELPEGKRTANIRVR